MAKKEKQSKDKPLEKMTATELREIAKATEGITGASGMNKDELVSAIKKARGIEETGNKRPAATMRQVKEKIAELKQQQESFRQEDNAKMIEITRRRISRLKKQTRRSA